MKSLQAPRKVSPTIKFVRWSLLFWGIFYGSNKKAILDKLEIKESVLRREAIERRRQREKEMTRRTYKETLQFFGELFGMEFPRNWEPPQ